MNSAAKQSPRSPSPYLSVLGAWALAFGCSVGWGSFVMPGTTFLPIAGPIGTAIGISAGAIAMLILGANFHYLMNRFPGGGGTYTYTKLCFGPDHGFVSAWFLILTYGAILWANATALPLILRTLVGDMFQFGFLYEIAGFQIYMGELLMVILSLAIAAVICLNRRVAANTQILMALILFGGILVCFGAAMSKNSSPTVFTPAFSPSRSSLSGVFTIFALAPWAFVGFESISHSTAEAKFPLKRTFPILVVAIVTAGAAYILLSLLAVTALPEGCETWVGYTQKLGSFSGAASQPTFFAARTALGTAGSVILGAAAVGGIFTGLIGNYIALSRLLRAMSEDGLFPDWLGKLDEYDVPRNAILVIFFVSLPLPFLGRTAISWIVDVTTVGATIAYAFASAATWRTAKNEGDKLMTSVGFVGIITSLLFALVFLIPNITSVSTLSTESYLILAVWSILGFLFFRFILSRDTERRFGRSIVAWVVLLGLIIFTSSVWMSQSVERTIADSVMPIQSYYIERLRKAGVDIVTGATQPAVAYVENELKNIDRSLDISLGIQLVMIIGALAILFDINRHMQRREKQIEIEKVLAEESSRAKSSFLSNMSHEIRTPMNAIIGLDNIALRNPNLQPQTRDQLEKIGASAKHLLTLINDILDMSRIESGRVVLKNEEFSFHEFLDQINIIINGQCEDKGLRYKCNIVGSVADYYCGDDMKLKQVLINILGNSVKFTNPPGSVTLIVEEVQRFEEKRTLRFSMRDTGVGMDKAFIPKIFEAFSQEDATSTNHYGGSGLGMAITKNFVEMMNGEIEVDSEKGVGSVFTVTVTLRASDRVYEPENGVSLPDGLTALVVDDDEIACEHTQIVLQGLGVRTEAVTSTTEALQMLRDAHGWGHGYDLLVTDYKMPDMNGMDLTKALHDFDGSKTAVIMLTGYNWEIIEDEAMAAGVDGIIAKPLFPDSLLHAIHSVLLKRAGIAPHPSVEAKEEAPVSARLAGCRVLMAEDVEQNAEILQDLLDLEDIESEHARNGRFAVELFSEKPVGYFDAILMDVRMPVMDGLAATRAIRALDRPDAKTIPIIAMTANVFDEDVERSLQAGMNAHLSKPIEPERLYETMARLVHRDTE